MTSFLRRSEAWEFHRAALPLVQGICCLTTELSRERTMKTYFALVRCFAIVFLACFVPYVGAQANLGQVNVGASASQAVTVTVTTAGVLGSVSVRMMGAENLDFTNAGGGSCAIGTPYALNVTCTVKVQFKPRLAGQRRGAVVLLDASGNILGTEYVRGTGGGPQATILTGVGVTTGIASPGYDGGAGVAADGIGNVWQEGGGGALNLCTPSGESYTCKAQTGVLGGIAVDGAGNVNYIVNADLVGNRLLLSTPGVYQGSGCQNLTTNPFFEAFAEAVDGAGNVYVEDDNGSYAVSKLVYSGVNCTVSYQIAGGGNNGFSDLAVDDQGNLFSTLISNPFTEPQGALDEFPVGAGGQYTTSNALSTGLEYPASPVLDGNGNIFLSDVFDQDTNVSPFGTMSTYIAALQSGGTYKPYAVAGNHIGPLALDGNGNLFTDGGQYKFNLLNPSHISFASTAIGQSSANWVITVANTGNSALKIGSVTYSTDFPEAKGITGECAAGQTVAVGGFCSITVVFSPVAPLKDGSSQALSEKIKLVSNSLNGASTEQDIPVTGIETPLLATIVLSSSANPSPSGSTVAFTAKLTAANGGPTPTGTVTFLDGSTTLGTGTLSSGTASYTAPNLADGKHSMTAQYSGDSAYAPLTSASLTQTIGLSTPVLTWPTPDPIDYPTPLSSVQLDATANVAGTFTYSPDAGTVLSAGQQTLTTTFTPADTSLYRPATASVTLTVVTPTPLQFVAVTPCRIADTRNLTGAFGGPELAAAATRTFDIPQSTCDIPSTAVAYSLNATVVPIQGLGFLTMWPAGKAQPLVSTLNSDGRVKANATITPAGTSGGISVYASDATQLILDIDGYFVPAGMSASGLEFFPLTPCRVADTRNATGALGGPSLAANGSRGFPVQSSACGIPSTAKAYSFNVTAVPHNALGFLTAWPSGQAQPVVSSLNSSTGAVTANAAIVPAGADGDVSIFVSDASDVILDVNGYFAAPATGGLSLYTVTPCRALDTRSSSGVFDGTLAEDIETSACTPPTTARDYVLNATVVPVDMLNYLTLWATGGAQPDVSTLNASDGAVTSNMAIVPTANGSIDVFSTDSTQLILDISGYFAP
jgi:hypothetical protein